MDPVALARFQFAMTVFVHFIFPSVSIGLGLVVAVLETGRWRSRQLERRAIYDAAATFWTKLFALTFVCGAATGIVLEFEFGTNWSAYAKFVGDIFGPPLAAEGVLAFFLESGFLGLLIFGRERISSRVRWFAALMVTVGSTMSAFWIIVADSFMQTPAGYRIVDGRARLVDFWAAVFNPSTMPRFVHTVIASWALAGFLVVGVSAWYLLRRRHWNVARLGLSTGLWIAVVATILIFVTGDASARQVATTQEAKFAAMQGVCDTTTGAPLVLFELPPCQAPAVQPGPSVEVTQMLSFLSFGSFQAAIKGLAAFPVDQWPPVVVTFLAYHNMVLLGTLMGLFMLFGVAYVWRGTATSHRTWLRLAVFAPLMPFVAIQLGWTTAEIGRQPWIVYGLMRTANGISTAVGAAEILATTIILAVIYVLLVTLWVRLMRKEILHGPSDASVGEEERDAVLVDVREPAPAGLAPRGR